MKTASGMMLAFILATMFVGLFFMSTSMDMSSGMTDCLFMSHEEVVCPMDFSDHVGAWKSVFLSLVPTFAMFLLAAAAYVGILSIAPNLLLKKWIPPAFYLRTHKERLYSFTYRPLQELFSAGILHPKLF